MTSVATPRFWKLYNELPPPIQLLAVKTYHLWQSNPRHPSLRFRPLEGSSDRYTIRIGAHHRALASVNGDQVTWVWIGTHADYDRLVR